MEWLKIGIASVCVGLLVAGTRIGMGSVQPDLLPWPEGIAYERPSPTPFMTMSVPQEGDWVLLIGGSGVYYAFDPEEMTTPYRMQTRARGYAEETAYALEWALEKTMKKNPPARVVWGLGALSLIDRGALAVHPCYGYARRTRPSAKLDAFIRPCEGVAQMKPREMKPKIGEEEPWVSLSEENTRLLLEVDPWFGMKEPTQDLVVTHFRRAVLGVDPPPQPPLVYSERLVNVPLKRRRRNLQSWKNIGLFKPNPFHAPNLRALKAVHNMLAERGIPLTIVSMPRHTVARVLYPEEGRTRFMEHISANSDDTIDLFSAVPDEGFSDHAHANAIGRKVFTQRLQEYLTGLGH